MRYEEDTYGKTFAEVYDTWYADSETEAFDLLEGLAEGGRVLELGIGTGRVALPLAERGLDLTGIDASQEMLDRLRGKPGAENVRLAHGSFADFPDELAAERYSLIYIVFNTLFGLLTQEEQVSCFESVAAHLTEEGRFLIEAFVPNLKRYDDDGQGVRVIQLDEGQVRLDAAELDIAAQQITSQQLVLSPKGVELYPVKLRYAWPSELDLMAQLAGLILHDRWGSWARGPFNKTSKTHISVYGRRRA
jgi:SAM-dependent methyltransferase